MVHNKFAMRAGPPAEAAAITAMAASPVEDLLLVATGACRLVSLDLSRIDALQVMRVPYAATPPTHRPTPLNPNTTYTHGHSHSKRMNIVALSLTMQCNHRMC